MSDRLFSEEEVAKVIRRAAELEAARSRNAKGSSNAGLSVKELEEIASASGLDPELVRQAATELDSSESTPHTASPEGKAIIDGNEIYAESWIDANAEPALIDLLITELNHKHGTSEDDVTWWNNLTGDYPGKARVKRNKHATEWIYTDSWQMSTTRVLFQGRNGRLRIRVSKRDTYGGTWENYGSYAWLFAFVLLIPAGIFGYIGTDSTMLTALIMTTAFILSFGVSRTYLTNLVSKEEQTITRIITDLTAYARELAPDYQKPASKTTGTESRRTIKIDDEEILPSESVAQKAQRLRNQLR
ncbi:hypothetical protein CYPRO_0259 [Cyclonatronum proteinivorum]|uniref:Uncharacterized protein n=1 Tax=Cyclonatronum proteinivorum TaxID=1457365 RepID=A0A345UGE5_9BACT|nr:hypothetical protein [Cyclonatronum proteinivorum]AXI99546.1 hypothetical protein CYPRO_0259 [Cyclonatronum proteinivorum]